MKEPQNMLLTDQYLDDMIRKVKHLNVDGELHTLILETAQGNIEDNGRGIDPEKIKGLLDDPNSGHIGCANANRRLKLLYGPEFGVEFLRTQHMVVHITMPCVRDSAAVET